MCYSRVLRRFSRFSNWKLLFIYSATKWKWSIVSQDWPRSLERQEHSVILVNLHLYCTAIFLLRLHNLHYHNVTTSTLDCRGAHLLIKEVLMVLLCTVKCRNWFDIHIHLPLPSFPKLFNLWFCSIALFLVAIKNCWTILTTGRIKWSVHISPLIQNLFVRNHWRVELN